MQVLQNYSLITNNSFRIDVLARFFSTFSDAGQLEELLRGPEALQYPLMILGGGSNILFTADFEGIVLKNEIRGIEKVAEDNDYTYVKAGAGENWHQFVLYCLENKYAGIENLSLIPGNVGASPMQNIGAYGVEIKDVFHELQAFHIRDKRKVRFGVADCEFGYRESVFKKKYRNEYVILDVTYKLRKQPIFNTSYGAIQEELEKMQIQDLTIEAVSNAVINIRRSKLPDPAIIGNAGSFFKNPQVSQSLFKELKDTFPGIIGYEMPDASVKLAAGWLIEQCGWKGFRNGDAGCHVRQALVLVNYGKASGNEIYDLSEKIMQSVRLKFGVDLEREVNVI